MKNSTLAISLLATSTVALSLFPSQQANPQESEVRFICADGYDQKTDQRLPTTYAWTERGKIAVVRWSTDYFEGAGFSPQERCEAVSPRFHEAYHNGTLAYLTNGTLNGEPVICTAESEGGECADLLLTLRPEDNEQEILTSLANVLQGRQSGPIRHDSEDPQIYYEVNMDSFLENAPVEEK